MTTARIKMIDVDRGFGFLTADDGSGDFFFHRSSVPDEAFAQLEEGDRVEFEVEPAAPKGPRARAVRRVSGAQVATTKMPGPDPAAMDRVMGKVEPNGCSATRKIRA